MFRSRSSRVLAGLIGLALWLAGPLPAAAQGPPLTARNLDPVVQPGDEVVVQISIGTKKNPVSKLLGVGFELRYDQSALRFLERKVGGLFAPNHPDNTLEVGPTVGGGAVDYSITLFNVAQLTDTFGEVVRLRFEAKKGAATGTYSFALGKASRSTGSKANISITNLNSGGLEIAEDRRGKRVRVRPGAVQAGKAEVGFGKKGQLAIDFSSLGAPADVTLTRNGNPIGGTSLPDVGGAPGEKATNSFWELSQTGASSFEADVCFGLSDLAVTTPDESTLRIFKRAGPSDSWSEVSSELRPTTDPTKICATDLTGFSQFAVAAPQGHSRTIVGTDGTGNDTGWRLLGLPVGAARSTLEEDLSFDVDSGHLLHRWQGGGPGAWSAVTSGSTQLPRGSGFILYFFDDSVDPLPSSGIPLDLPATSEDQTANVTVDGLTQSNRFHLLGNPYDVAFDLGSFAGGDLPSKGFQSTVQIWDPAIPGWTTVTQGGNDNLAAWQGFFVERQSTGSGNESLTFNSSGRQSGEGDLIGSKAVAAGSGDEETPSALVELGLTVANETDTLGGDVANVLFIEGAKPGWDAYEASQLPPPNSSSYATLSSPIEREGDLVRRLQASRAYPTTTDTVTVPLSVQAVQVSGTAHLRWPEEKRGEWPEDWAVKLEDTETDERTDLREGSYGFDLSAGDGASLSGPEEARFRLHVVPGSSIPVELSGFSAQATGEGAVRLTWQTASETENAGFYVQRREGEGTKGQEDEWTQVGFVEGAGTTSALQSYRFTDAEVPFEADRLTYRLRQVDTDGSESLSRPVTVRRGAPARLVLKGPIPNPISGQATVHLGMPEATTVQMAVYDLLGRRVETVASGHVDAGRHERRLDVGSWAGGTYFLRLKAGKESKTRKFTVVR